MDANDTLNKQLGVGGSPEDIFNFATGLLSKAVEYDIERRAIKAQTGKEAPGQVAPTGHSDPATVISEQTQTKAPAAQILQYMPYVIGGAIVLVAIFAALKLRK